jgi:hypothetical protein
MSYIERGGFLSGAEAQLLVEEEERRINAAIETQSTRGRQRVLSRRNISRSLQHKVPTCSNQQSTQ